MKRNYHVWAIIIVIALVSTALAGDSYLIIVENITGNNQSRLEGYPGWTWGKAIDKIYLHGDTDEIDWLENRNFAFRTVELENEPSVLYLCHGIDENNLS